MIRGTTPTFTFTIKNQDIDLSAAQNVYVTLAQGSKLIEKAVVSLDDADALDAVELFKSWYSGVSYLKDERVQYGGRLYRCVQPHTSQIDWEPDRTPALWSEVAKPGEIPVWRQPTGAQDAYNTGDLVHYPDANGPVYRSTIDNNVWSPEAYSAWWEVVE